MQKHDSGSMSFLKASLTGGRRLSGDDCRPSRAHMPRRGRQALQGPHATKRKAEWWDRVGQNPRAKTRDLSRQLSQTVVRPFSYQIEKRLHGPHSPLIFVSSDLLSLLNKIQVQHHNRGCQGPTTKLFHSKVQNRPS